MADTQLTGQLSEAVKETLGFKGKPLVSRPEWGTIKFTNAEKDLERIFSLLSYLSILPLEYLTDQATNQIKNQIDQTRPHLDQIDKLSESVSTANQFREADVRGRSLVLSQASWLRTAHPDVMLPALQPWHFHSPSLTVISIVILFQYEQN
jgi:hypothetical protein